MVWPFKARQSWRNWWQWLGVVLIVNSPFASLVYLLKGERVLCVSEVKCKVKGIGQGHRSRSSELTPTVRTALTAVVAVLTLVWVCGLCPHYFVQVALASLS